MSEISCVRLATGLKVCYFMCFDAFILEGWHMLETCLCEFWYMPLGTSWILGIWFFVWYMLEEDHE
jgi:hypothetical protein